MSLPMLTLAALGLGYGLYARGQQPSPLPGGQMQQVLADSTDAQFVAFVAVTFWLLATLRLLPDIGKPADLLRYGSHAALTARTGLQGSVTVLAGALLLTVCWAVTTIGSPQAAGQVYVVVSAVAYLAQILLVTTTLVVIRVLLVWVRLRWNRRSIEYVVAASVWLWSALSAAGLIDDGSALNAGRFLNISLAVHTTQTLVSVILLSALAVAGVLFGARILDSYADFSAAFRTGAGPFALIAALTAVVTVIVEPTWQKALESLFAGASGTITGFLVSVVLTVGFTYLAAQRFANLQAGGIEPELIRIGSGARWIRKQLIGELLRAVLYLATVLVAVTVGAVIVGSGLDINAVTTYEMLVNGSLELLLYSAIVLTTVWLIPGQIASLGALGALVVVSFVVGPTAGPSPIGHPFVPNAQWDTVLVSTGLIVAAILVVGMALMFATRFKPAGLKEG